MSATPLQPSNLQNHSGSGPSPGGYSRGGRKKRNLGAGPLKLSGAALPALSNAGNRSQRSAPVMGCIGSPTFAPSPKQPLSRATWRTNRPRTLSGTVLSGRHCRTRRENVESATSPLPANPPVAAATAAQMMGWLEVQCAPASQPCSHRLFCVLLGRQLRCYTDYSLSDLVHVLALGSCGALHCEAEDDSNDVDDVMFVLSSPHGAFQCWAAREPQLDANAAACCNRRPVDPSAARWVEALCEPHHCAPTAVAVLLPLLRLAVTANQCLADRLFMRVDDEAQSVA